MTKNTEKQTNSSEVNEKAEMAAVDNMASTRDHWITLNGEKVNNPAAPTDNVPRPIIVRQVKQAAGYSVPMHSHDRGQLLSISEGLMHVSVKDIGNWVVPPHRAVWIPAFIEHDAKAIQAVNMQNVYITPEASSHLPEQCQVMAITPLLRELLGTISQFNTLYDEQGSEGRLVQVMLDQLQSIPQLPLHLPLPSHKALLKISNTLMDCPADNRSLEEWAAQLGFSERTLARYFKAETNMTFGQWRQQARLLAAITRIAEGDSIANIAQDLGYNNQSAFIAMFKKALGKTPARYFDYSP